MRMKLHIGNPQARVISKTVDILLSGGVCIYPTDTIYGLGCSIENKRAIERIYLLKRMRSEKPFSFVCSDLSHITDYAHVSNMAFKIMKRLIPGPYTFILPAARMKNLPRILISKRKTVGIRVPNNVAALSLVKALGHPILSTSVTTETGEVLNDPDDIFDHFNSVVDIILDGGPLISEPSSVIDLTGSTPEIIRVGAGDVSMLQ